jgi:transmembrane sensor
MSDESTPRSAALQGAGLSRPLRELTQLGVDEWTVRRMWDGIQRRSAAVGSPPGRRLTSGRAVSLAVAFVLALLVGTSWLWLRAAGEGGRSPIAAGPLLLEGGRHFDQLEAAEAGQGERASFADGSSIELEPGARVEGLATSGTEVVVLVRQGRARFSVTPGGPRRWRIETGSARVEVMGTVLSVENAAGFVAVSVEEGVVLVRSALLRDGVRRVRAGQSLRIEPPGALPLEAAAPPVVTPEELPLESSERTERAPRRRPGMSAAELWAGADQARQAGDAARAATLLERLLYEHPGDSQAALGAYTLGRLQLEQLAKPRAAAQSFQQALELGLTEALRESCYVRWAEALRRAGQGAALRGVAAEYLSHYPKGAQRQAMQRLLEQTDPLQGTP